MSLAPPLFPHRRHWVSADSGVCSDAISPMELGCCTQEVSDIVAADSSFGKPAYLLDVALDELWGGHQLGRQAVLQLQFARRADWLAPLGPARKESRTETVCLRLSARRAEALVHSHACTRVSAPASEPLNL